MLDAGGEPLDAWVWVPLPDTVRLDKGRHTVTVRARERGAAIDRIALTVDGEPPPE